MIYGYARVSTDGQSVAAQVAALRKHGAGKVFREVASGAKTDRAQLRRVLDQLDAGVTQLIAYPVGCRSGSAMVSSAGPPCRARPASASPASRPRLDKVADQLK